MLSGEDKNSESSGTEVPQQIEHDTKEPVPKRGNRSVVWKFVWLFKKMSIKEQFSKCCRAKVVGAGGNMSNLRGSLNSPFTGVQLRQAGFARRSSHLHLWSFMLKAASSTGPSWEQEAESWSFLSARCRRGRTLWRNRSFLSFTCRKSQTPR